MPIKNKKKSMPVAIVTGGRGGIGQTITNHLVKEGFLVLALGRHKSSNDKSEDFYVTDVADFGAVQRTVSKIIKKYKKIDLLVNAAGIIGAVGPFHLNDMKLWSETISINLLGTAQMCRAVLPFMLKRGQGKIINFSGGGAVQPFENFSAYATSKAAVVRFTENLAREYEKNNIQINSIAPRLINTKMLDIAIKAGKKMAGSDYYNRVMEAKKTGGDDPNTAAELIAWLAKPKNKLTGKLISAKWDGWKHYSAKKILQLNKSSQLTLRRIDNKYFYAK